MRIALGVPYASGESVISKGSQRIVHSAHQRPGKALRLHGVSEILLRRAQTPGFAFDLEKQHPSLGENDQIGKGKAHRRDPARRGAGASQTTWSQMGPSLRIVKLELRQGQEAHLEQAAKGRDANHESPNRNTPSLH